MVPLYPKRLDPPMPNEFSTFVLEYTGLKAKDQEGFKKLDSAEDLAKLSLSEAVEGEESSDTNILHVSHTQQYQLHRQRRKQLEQIIDTAINTFNDIDDDGKSPYFKEDDLSKIVLRRVTIDDIGAIERLLKKEENCKKQSSNITFLNALSRLGPLSLMGKIPKSDLGEWIDSNDDISDIASQLCGSTSTILLLSRALALPEEPPLGFAVLSFGFSLDHGRTLCISEIANEVHFPRERLIECLEKLGKIMKCHIELCAKPCESKGIFIKDSSLCNVIKMYTNYDNQESTSKSPCRFHGVEPLQSVKEEDNEDEDILKNDQTHKRPKLQ
jgi:hypothetical protein